MVSQVHIERLSNYIHVDIPKICVLVGGTFEYLGTYICHCIKGKGKLNSKCLGDGWVEASNPNVLLRLVAPYGNSGWTVGG